MTVNRSKSSPAESTRRRALSIAVGAVAAAIPTAVAVPAGAAADPIWILLFGDVMPKALPIFPGESASEPN
jgi:hypothetical protein